MRWLKRQSWKSVIFIWLTILGLITGVQLVEENLDNRSKADNEVNFNVCKVDFDEGLLGGNLTEINLCNEGRMFWLDKAAMDGNYNWSCVSDDGEVLGQCSFEKKKN